MKYYELEYELKLAYKRGYEDKGVRDYDFHQHSYELLDNFERKSCDGCEFENNNFCGICDDCMKD